MILRNSFLDLLIKDGSFTVYQTNIQILSLEMYKVKHYLCESCFKDLFNATNSNYKIHFQSDFRVLDKNTVFLRGEFNLLFCINEME